MEPPETTTKETGFKINVTKQTLGFAGALLSFIITTVLVCGKLIDTAVESTITKIEHKQMCEDLRGKDGQPGLLRKFEALLSDFTRVSQDGKNLWSENQELKSRIAALEKINMTVTVKPSPEGK